MYQGRDSLRNQFSENMFYPDSASSKCLGFLSCFLFKIAGKKTSQCVPSEDYCFFYQKFHNKTHFTFWNFFFFLSEDKMVTGKDIFKIGLLLLSSNATGNNVLPGELLINLPETPESTKSNKENLGTLVSISRYQQIISILTRMIRQDLCERKDAW